MREALGSTMMLYIIIPIILVFIFFIGFIMNYASAYRSANYLITQIETCNGNISSGCDHVDFSTLMENLKTEYHYDDNIRISCMENGTGSIYRVQLPISFDLPLIGRVGVYNVKSETKTLQNGICESAYKIQ